MKKLLAEFIGTFWSIMVVLGSSNCWCYFSRSSIQVYSSKSRL